MTTHRENVLVIGLGNTLRSDDAVGRLAARQVEAMVESDQVIIVDQCQLTPELAAEIAAATLVIFLDASLDGPPDRIVTRTLMPTKSIDAMAHQLDAPSVLGLADALYGRAPHAVAITIRGQSFDLSDAQLSAHVSSACDQLVSETLRLIDVHLSNTADCSVQEP